MAVFTDNFDGTAGTLLSARAGWQLGAGYYDVLELDGAGAIRHNGFSDDGKYVVHDVGERRQYFKVTLGAGFLVSDAAVGVTFGYVDMSNNYSIILLNGKLLLRIGGGSLSELGVWAAGDVLECIFYADIHDIVIKKNGAMVGTYSSAAYNWNTSGTKVGVWLSYAGQPATADILRSFEAGTLAAPDTTAPTHTGTVAVTAKSASSIATSCPTATDNVAVTSYDVRIDGGAWIDKGLATSHNFTGLTADTAHTIDWTARDAAGNRSTPPLSVSTSTYPLGAMASTILLITGPQEGNPAGMLYALAGTVQPGDWLSYYIVSGPTPAGGVLDAQANGAFTYTGPAPATMVIQPQVNGVDVAQITVTLYDQSGGGDTEQPVHTGVITVNSKTGTSINVSCPVATDNVGVDHYEWSKDAGATWVNGTTTHNFEGLTLSTTYPIRARAADAAGLKSIPALELSVTTDAAAVPPVLPGGITVVSKTQTAINVSCQEATGDVTGYEWSRDGGTTWESGATTHSFTGLTAATPYAIRARAFGPGGISAVLSLTVTTDPAVTGAALTSSPQVNNTTTVQANVTGITVHVYDAATGDKVVTKTGQSTDANGVMVLSDALLTAGTTYRFVVVYSGGDEGMEKAVAS